MPSVFRSLFPTHDVHSWHSSPTAGLWINLPSTVLSHQLRVGEKGKIENKIEAEKNVGKSKPFLFFQYSVLSM